MWLSADQQTVSVLPLPVPTNTSAICYGHVCKRLYYDDLAWCTVVAVFYSLKDCNYQTSRYGFRHIRHLGLRQYVWQLAPLGGTSGPKSNDGLMDYWVAKRTLVVWILGIIHSGKVKLRHEKCSILQSHAFSPWATLGIYCLVNEILQCGEIMRDVEKCQFNIIFLRHA